LSAAQRSAEELSAALTAERERMREETSRHATTTAELTERASAQAAELTRRLSWQWRLRSPWRR
jgi:hypothetical protein